MNYVVSQEDYENSLSHYGILRRSGRYPWGSGGTAEKRSLEFLDLLQDMRSKGLSDVEIAKGFGMTTTQLRETNTIARAEKKAAQIAMINRLADKGMSNGAIAERMGLPGESSVRALRAAGQADKAVVLQNTVKMLRDNVEKKGVIDIGKGVELYNGISREKLSSAVAVLKDEGYKVHYIKVQQQGTTHETTIKVLARDDIRWVDIKNNPDMIKSTQDFSSDTGGRSYFGLLPPIAISSKRVAVNYAEDGGADADGVMYIRRGVKELDMGGARYAQVRVSVDGTHYLKGMAVYKDDLPPGTDIVFNTNKKRADIGDDKMKAFKEMKKGEDGIIDADNPFGSAVRQLGERNERGELVKVTSALNIVNEEGSWDKWSRNLSSQMLSKQSNQLARTQLNETFERRRKELDEIMSLTNPAVKQKLLEDFADSTDSAAVHLKAAALPRQRSQVILPINSLKDTEIYAPNFENGERVVLVRYPHGGIFEIPELTVNNRHPEARRILGSNPKDAVGINSRVAARLSGADFDGDSVLVIPNNSGAVKTKPPLQKLVGFDPQAEYPRYEGMKVMDARTKGIQMGLISNLITDMTIRGATDDELAKAVRHSMVVIDAEKHKLNWKQSAIDNSIPTLMKKYQDRSQGGASTVISNSGAEAKVKVPKRKQGYQIDKKTGEKIYRETGESYIDKNGKLVFKTQSVPRLSVNDAHKYSSGTPIEKIYADHSNGLKSLANEARLALVNTKPTPYSPSANKAYHKEVAELNSALRIALKNAPRERQAQVLAAAVVKQKLNANPEMDPPELKKVRAQTLAEMRLRTGAKKEQIKITPEQWNAIQAGALRHNTLTQILKNADDEKLKELATPRTPTVMTSAKQARAASMLASGYTQAEVAAALGVSLTTLKNDLKN